MGAFLSLIYPSKKQPLVMDHTLFKETTAHDVLSQKKIDFPVDDASTAPSRNINVWTPTNVPVVGIVIISHGIHEHGLRYHHVAHSFTKRGFVVYAIDHYAHGQSDGKRALITDYKILPKDLVHLASIARSAHPNLPLTIVAHSMGTLIALIAVTSIPDVKCIVLSGCGLMPGPSSASPFGITWLYWVSTLSFAETIAGIIAMLAPDGDGAPVLECSLTHNAKVLHNLHIDPNMYCGPVRNKTAYEFLKMVAATKDILNQVKMPLLCMHGKADTCTLPAGSEYVIEHCGTPPDLKILKEWDGLYHEIYNEEDADAAQCIQFAGDFISNHMHASPLVD